MVFQHSHIPCLLPLLPVTPLSTLCCCHFVLHPWYQSLSLSLYPLPSACSLGFHIDLPDIPRSHSCGEGFRLKNCWHLPPSHNTPHLNPAKWGTPLQWAPALWKGWLQTFSTSNGVMTCFARHEEARAKDPSVFSKHLIINMVLFHRLSLFSQDHRWWDGLL